jgi:hypothetical protein
VTVFVKQQKVRALEEQDRRWPSRSREQRTILLAFSAIDEQHQSAIVAKVLTVPGVLTLSSARTLRFPLFLERHGGRM